MKVHFTFKKYTGTDRSSTFRVFDKWEYPLPNIGDFISSDDDYHCGSVSRIEWNLDKPNEVYVIID